MANSPPPLGLLAFLLFSAVFLVTSTATNYTVGGNAGWLFSSATNASAANYTAWAASLSFHLGDFLIFNTDANSTVIQTYNATTYRLCSLEEDYGNLTSQFGADDVEDGGGAGGIPVQLVKEGDNYFFSSAEGGLQCKGGMTFYIQVQKYGSGLPPAAPLPPSPVVVSAGVGGWKWRWGIASSVSLSWFVLLMPLRPICR